MFSLLRTAAIVPVFTLFLAALPAGAGEPRTITLFAAASTSEVVSDAVQGFEKKTGIKVKLNMASSGSLARQITSGSPADLFLSASVRWSNWLAEKKGVRTDSVRELMRNRLVLITPKDGGPITIRFARDFAFADAFKGRLSVGDPAHVPAGRYAMEALKSYGWDKAVAKRLLPAQHVRAAMLMVELGECDLGIVYATDAKASAKVRTIATFPEAAHSPIVYTLSICQDTRALPEAKQLWSYLQSDDTVAIMTRLGFTPSVTDND
jgi:molybdate transport system substrate-binding protein